MGSNPLPGCNISPLKPEIINQQIAELNAALSSGWKAVKRIHIAPRVPLNGSLSRKSLAYLRACALYLQQVSKVLKKEIVTSHTGPRSVKALQGIFGCILLVSLLFHLSECSNYETLWLSLVRKVFMFIEAKELC